MSARWAVAKRGAGARARASHLYFGALNGVAAADKLKVFLFQRRKVAPVSRQDTAMRDVLLTFHGGPSPPPSPSPGLGSAHVPCPCAHGGRSPGILLEKGHLAKEGALAEMRNRKTLVVQHLDLALRKDKDAA